MLGFDFYIFYSAANVTKTLNVFVGMFLTGNDLVYLILIPMLIARRMQKNVKKISVYKICFAGTIVGIVLALCLVGKYLIS